MNQHTILRICIIDDDESIRESFKLHLEELGHQVTTFENAEAMLMLANFCGPKSLPCFDVIFVDYEMPKISGFEFLKHSESNDCKMPSDRKFIMSGAIPKHVEEEALKMGCCVLKKPVRLGQIDQILSKISNKSPVENS